MTPSTGSDIASTRLDERTEPLVQLLHPCLAGIFDGRIQKDDLILDTNLMHDWLEHEFAFQVLEHGFSRERWDRRTTDLLVLSLVSSLVRNVAQSNGLSSRAVFIRALEFGTPQDDDML